MCVRECVCVHVYVCVRVCVCIYTYRTHTHTLTATRSCDLTSCHISCCVCRVSRYVCTRARVYAYVCIYIHIHITHAYTHIPGSEVVRPYQLPYFVFRLQCACACVCVCVCHTQCVLIRGGRGCKSGWSLGPCAPQPIPPAAIFSKAQACRPLLRCFSEKRPTFLSFELSDQGRCKWVRLHTYSALFLVTIPHHTCSEDIVHEIVTYSMI